MIYLRIGLVLLPAATLAAYGHLDAAAFVIVAGGILNLLGTFLDQKKGEIVLEIKNGDPATITVKNLGTEKLTEVKVEPPELLEPYSPLFRRIPENFEKGQTFEISIGLPPGSAGRFEFQVSWRRPRQARQTHRITLK